MPHVDDEVALLGTVLFVDVAALEASVLVRWRRKGKFVSARLRTGNIVAVECWLIGCGGSCALLERVSGAFPLGRKSGVSRDGARKSKVVPSTNWSDSLVLLGARWREIRGER